MKNYTTIAQKLYLLCIKASKIPLKDPNGKTVVFGKMRPAYSDKMDIIVALRLFSEGNEGTLAIGCALAQQNWNGQRGNVTEGFWNAIETLDNINARGKQVELLWEYYGKDIDRMISGVEKQGKGTMRFLEMKAEEGKTDGWLPVKKEPKAKRKSLRLQWA